MKTEDDQQKKPDQGLVPAVERRALEMPDTMLEEQNILRMEGRLFCFDPTNAGVKTGEHEYQLRDGRSLTLIFDHTYGQPTTLAYKVLQAIFKKLTDEGLMTNDKGQIIFPNEVAFSQRELHRLTGGKTFGGGQAERLYKAVMQLGRTRIHSEIYEKETSKWVHYEFSLLPQVLFSGKKRNIDTCLIKLADPIIDSLNSRHWACFNWDKLKTLQPIGMAIYKRLHYHLANRLGHLIKQHKQKGLDDDAAFEAARSELVFEKDYEDICTEWLGGLSPQKHVSAIKQRLGKHINAVKRTALLDGWTVERRAKKGEGFKLVFRPGNAFYLDYERFYLGRGYQQQLRFNHTRDTIQIQRPLELVNKFYMRLHNVHAVDTAMYNPKEVAFASKLLDQYGFDQAVELINYAFAEAPKTKFDMKTLHAVKTYIPAWEARSTDRRQDEKRRRLERQGASERALMDAYDQYLKSHIRHIEANLTPEELTEFDSQADKQFAAKYPDKVETTSKLQQSMNSTFLGIIRRDLIKEKLPALSFEEWSQERSKTSK